MSARWHDIMTNHGSVLLMQWGYAHAFIFSCPQLVWGLAHFKCSPPDPKLGQKCTNSFGHEWGRRKSIFRETNAVLHRISAPCFLKGSRDLKKKVVFLKNVSPFDVDPSQRACGGGAEPPRHPKIQNSSKCQHMSNYFQTFQTISNYVRLFQNILIWNQITSHYMTLRQNISI